jgi:parvulin-like peptidyl-prolyl isomerase
MRPSLLSMMTLILLSFSACQQEKTPPGVLARVDDTLITVEDFNRESQALKLENPFSPGGHEMVIATREKFLDQLIEKALVLREAKRLGVTVEEDELEEEIMETKNEYKGESLREYLNRHGMSFEDWRERVREKMRIEKTIAINSNYKGIISTEEAREYYESHPEAYLLPDRVKARHIVVASKRKATQILRKLRKGQEFEKLAVENSLGPEGRFGGDLGYFGKGDMPDEFEVVFSMEKGDVSKIVKSPYGYHIFKVEDKAPGRQLKFEEVIDDVKGKIAQLRSEQRYYQWLEELKKNARIEINRNLLEYTN